MEMKGLHRQGSLATLAVASVVLKLPVAAGGMTQTERCSHARLLG